VWVEFTCEEATWVQPHGSVINGAPGTRPLTVAVVGRKGGAGKTTTSFNLAGALAARDLRTLMIDLDPQASLTSILIR